MCFSLSTKHCLLFLNQYVYVWYQHFSDFHCLPQTLLLRILSKNLCKHIYCHSATLNMNSPSDMWVFKISILKNFTKFCNPHSPVLQNICFSLNFCKNYFKFFNNFWTTWQNITISWSFILKCNSLEKLYSLPYIYSFFVLLGILDMHFDHIYILLLM